MTGQTRNHASQGGDADLYALLPLVAARLPAVLPEQRWYGGKGQAVSRVTIRDTAAIPGHPSALLVVIDVEAAGGTTAGYFLPLGLFSADQPAPAGQVIVRQGQQVVRDAIGDPDTCRALLHGILTGATLPTAHGGAFVFEAINRPDRPAKVAASLLDVVQSSVRFVGVEQSNTSVIFGDRLILKALRRLAPGTNPEIEIPRFLGEHTGFDRVPPLVGWAEYRPRDGEAAPVGVLQAFVPNDGDGWAYVLRLAATMSVAGAASDEVGRRLAGDMAALGRTLAGLHIALASRPDIPAFAPEPISALDLETWHQRTTLSLDDVLRCLAHGLPEHASDQAQIERDRLAVAAILEGEDRLRSLLGGIRVLADGTVVKTRHHGDFHLGQTLVTPDGWMLIDFEGEPLRPIEERRARQTPLRDVAGLLRSLEYARATAERQPGADVERLARAFAACRTATLTAYVETIRKAGLPLIPPSSLDQTRVLLALELEKALYEFAYELGNRPDWVSIPLAALARLARPNDLSTSP